MSSQSQNSYSADDFEKFYKQFYTQCEISNDCNMEMSSSENKIEDSCRKEEQNSEHLLTKFPINDYKPAGFVQEPILSKFQSEFQGELRIKENSCRNVINGREQISVGAEVDFNISASIDKKLQLWEKGRPNSKNNTILNKGNSSFSLMETSFI